MENTGSSGSYSTRMAFIASKAVSSSTAATAATGSPTKRTLSVPSACSSWLTGRMPNGIGRSRPVRIAITPGIARARVVSIETMRACGTCARWILQCSMRGRKRSSAKRVAPVHSASPSTLRTGFPTTLRRGLRASAMEGLVGGHRTGVAQAPRGQLDRLEDLEVPGTAAEVARQRLAGPIARRLGVALEQLPGGAQDPGRAVAALGGPELRERGLQGVRRVRPRQALDGDDRPSLALDREDEARQHRAPVEQDGAGAALPQLAAVLGPGEPEVLAQRLEERPVRCDRRLDRLAVHHEADQNLAGRRRGRAPARAPFHRTGGRGPRRRLSRRVRGHRISPRTR